MANKRITDVDFIESLNSGDSFFVNNNSTIKQINKKNILFDKENIDGMQEMQENISDIQEDINGMQRSISGMQKKIAISSISGQSVSVASETPTSVATLFLEAGTYLVMSSVTVYSGNLTDSPNLLIKACLTSTGDYDNTSEACVCNVPGTNMTVNPWRVFTLESATTITLMAYHQTGANREAVNGRIFALQIA